MLNRYRAAGIACADDLLESVVAVLSRYPVEVIDHVTGPDGLYSACKWFPSGREVTDACEVAMEPIRRQEERERIERETVGRRQQDQGAPRNTRLSYDDLVAHYGPNWGLGKEMPLCEEAYQCSAAVAMRRLKREYVSPTDDDLRRIYGTRTPEQLAEDTRRSEDFKKLQQARKGQAA